MIRFALARTSRSALPAIFAIVVATQSCKPRMDSGLLDTPLTDAEKATIMAVIQDGKFSGADAPRDTLVPQTRRLQRLSAGCGMDSGVVRPFKATSSVRGYFDENDGLWRLLSRPGNDCRPEEKAGTDLCQQEFGLQFYPTGKPGDESPYLVNGTSPIIRFLPKAQYPRQDRWCAFDNDSALIWVGGIRNPELGTTWQNTDLQLLGAIMAWNGNNKAPVLLGTPQPTQNSKLASLPGYIQLVPNAGVVVSGVLGSHDNDAIRRLANNLQLAYRAGVNRVEIVSHSNGGITTQQGLQVFLEELKANANGWQRDRQRLQNAAAQMQVNVFHLQAAPSQKWSWSKLNRFEAYSDFIRNAVWVRKTRLGVPYWGWDWDFSVYQIAQQHLNLSVRFFYNRPDFWTYPILSVVGRSKSLAWHNEVIAEGSSRGVALPIQHFSCDDDSSAQCGPDHRQREVLWSFADPKQRIPWTMELGTGRAASRSLPSAAAAAAVPEAMPMSDINGADEMLAKPQIPAFVCVDIAKHADFCRDLASREQAPDSGLPSFGCAPKDEPNHPCTSISVGDTMCSLPEQDDADLRKIECNLPKDYTSCECKDGQCENNSMLCKDGICQTKKTRAEGCHCRQGQDDVTCPQDAPFCRVDRLNGVCRRQVGRGLVPGATDFETCEGVACVARTRGLERAGPAAAAAAFPMEIDVIPGQVADVTDNVGKN